jgi:DNA invertase Pin-like site-specific DNA recombinase
MRHLVNVLGELNGFGVQLFSYKQGVDTSTPMGAMLWQFLGIFAEFENGIRRERQAIGIAKAKERGVRFGRPRRSEKLQREVLALRHQGLGINKIARQLRVGTRSVVRTLRMASVSTKQQDLAA